MICFKHEGIDIVKNKKQIKKSSRMQPRKANG